MELENKIIHGDCLEILKQIPDNSVDLIYTDPPYLIPRHSKKDKGKFSLKFKSLYSELCEYDLTDFDSLEWCEDAIRVMKKVNIYIWCSKKQIPLYFDFFIKQHGCSFYILEWIKTNPLPNYNNQYQNDKEYCLYFRKKGYCQPKDLVSAKTYFLQPINQEDKKFYYHPTIKPLNIVKQMIENSTHEGDIVLDPFLGSGTTAVACHQLKRKYIGIEKQEEFYKTALKRIDDEKKILELF